MYRFMFDHPGVVIGGACLIVAAWMIVIGMWVKGAEQVREDDEL